MENLCAQQGLGSAMPMREEEAQQGHPSRTPEEQEPRSSLPTSSFPPITLCSRSQWAGQGFIRAF